MNTVNIDDIFEFVDPEVIIKNGNMIINDFENTTNKKDEYSIWLQDANVFTPAMKLKICKKIPSGVYKIGDDNKGNLIISKQTIDYDEIFQFENTVMSEILSEVREFWGKKDHFAKYNLLHKRGILLEGPAGNSKTSTINLIIKELIKDDGLVFLVNSAKEFLMTFEGLPNIVREIEPNRPIITIIEDIDKIINSFSGDDSSLLDFLDGKHAINHHVVIMTSNNTSDLSEAMLRPSRVDSRFILSVPDESVRQEYLLRKGMQEDKIKSVQHLIKGMSFAQLKEFFIGVQVFEKDPEQVANQILHPLEVKNYLNSKPKNKIGI